MLSNFAISNNKILIKNTGEYFGALGTFEYNIGDKLYEFATMEHESFDKLKAYYNQLIDLVCYSKESYSMEIEMDCYFKMFQIVRAGLQLSPYTHFHTQLLIDIIIKTYNSSSFRTDLLFKSDFGIYIDNSKYYPKEIYSEIEEDEYTTEILLAKWIQEINKVSTKKHHEYLKFFETIRDLLIEDLMKKRFDLKERLELISEYSSNSLVKNLSVPEKIFLYETKRVFDIHYFNTKPAHSVFLDAKFKTKYIIAKPLAPKETRLSLEETISLIKKRNLNVEEVFELNNTEEQIRFEIFKIIQNNFTINKCENCGKLFIPITSSKNPYQKGRNDQKYCNNLYKDTGKTCKEIGALAKHKEKIEESLILKEYTREYKRMHGLHYNHQKKFTENNFKEWSKKASKLRDTYTDEQIEEFKNKLNELSALYYK